MSHRDILKIVAICGTSEGGLRRQVAFFETDIYDAEFLGASFGTIRYSQNTIFQELFGI